MDHIKRSCLFLLVFIFPFIGWASPLDTLQLVDGTVLVGQIKSMERGLLVLKVDFSEKNLEVNFSKISNIKSVQSFLVSLENGLHIEAEINQFEGDSLNFKITHPTRRQQSKYGIKTGDFFRYSREDIIQFYQISESIKSRIDGEIGIGFNLAKANNLRQYSLRDVLRYNGNRFMLVQYFNGIRSIQKETIPIYRYDASMVGLYYLPKEWFVMGLVSFLSNTQQLLDLRTGYKVGFGKFLVYSNKATWSFIGGVNLNREKFKELSTIQKSTEGVFTSQFEVKDFSVFDIISTLSFFNSFTEANRVRTDFRLDIKYDLLDDLYLKLGTSVNYDNQPTEGASKTDYIIQTTIGWIF
ncbi:DUF481 domain-containing protein [Algoriphagus limi]|uniref:DUF481 domain-containing protein n=1 Tax=Algoriphagus limi TaxID=2975273 RepID=A0ABT2G7H1_9BACT|nr:DUF481 domain-containing protein [Algoriphagus limi]MCS5491220.1 DUF481 domain-containing protein [Algoriphagus limi]